MRIFITLILFVLLTAPACANTLNGNCEILFFGSSTLHDFEGKGSCKAFSLDIDADGKLNDTRLEVPVIGMDTDNDGRDENMHEMFEAKKFPHIVGTLQPAKLSELRSQLHQAATEGTTFPLNLRIRDTDQQLQAHVLQLVDTAKAFSVDLEFPLSLESYQLDPPSVLFISVDDEIRVQVKLHLAPLPTIWQP